MLSALSMNWTEDNNIRCIMQLIRVCICACVFSFTSKYSNTSPTNVPFSNRTMNKQSGTLYIVSQKKDPAIIDCNFKKN